MTQDYAARARALVGRRFRAQGRGIEGLDCVGVALATYQIDDSGLRANYRISDADEAELRAAIERHFRRITMSELRASDVMVMKVSERQLHLAVKTEAGFVHAHAGIRRVVETPGMPMWPLLACYRRRRRLKKA